MVTDGKAPCADLDYTEKLLQNFLSAVERFDIHTTHIIVGHPSYLITLDMKQFPRNCYFISVAEAEPGKLLEIQESDLKHQLYRFIKEHPDRVWKGEKYE